jgi:NO-binding membrane sensor protein with MHYT domain
MLQGSVRLAAEPFQDAHESPAPMTSLLGDPSVLLWMAAAVIAFMGARTFVEYLRRLHHEGPLVLWREWLLGTAALTAGAWSSLVLDISAQGLVFEVGYHPLKIFGALLIGFLLMTVVVGWATLRPNWYSQLGAAALASLVLSLLQVSVIWSIGAEPGLFWRTEPLVFALMLQFVGVGAAGRMVTGVKRGSPSDRASRRLLAALVLGACTLAAHELVLSGSGIDRQVVSAHARFLPEVAITLVAGAVVPIGLVLLYVDQRSQQRARASYRRRRRRMGEGGEESMFAESAFVSISDTKANQPPR